LVDEARTILFEAIKYKEICESSIILTEKIISLDDRISCYLSFVKTLKEKNELDLLMSICQDAGEKFEGLPKAFYFTKLKSHVLIKHGDMKQALQILADIPPVSLRYQHQHDHNYGINDVSCLVFCLLFASAT
jgi:hypothetical protein